jgi:lysyl-tRNA synthetase class II
LFLGINILPGVSGEIFHLPFWLKIGTLEKLLKMFMSICLSKNIGEMVGQEVTVRGWLYNKRSSGSIAFLEIRDGFGWLSAVASKSGVSESVWTAIESLNQESSLTVTGLVKQHPKKIYQHSQLFLSFPFRILPEFLP